MSFTIMRYRNGKPEPIKLSIWDAFKGAPPPKPRLHECPRCGKVHRPGTRHVAPEPEKPATTEKQPDNPSEEAKSPESTASNEHNFTPEEDSKILEMKAGNASWAEIAEALGNERTKGMVKHRYKQINLTEDAKKPEDDTKQEKKLDSNLEQKPIEQMSKKEKKAFMAQQHREAGLKKKEEAKAKREDAEAEAAKAEGATVEKPDSGPSTSQAETESAKVQAPPEVKSSRTAPSDKQKWIAAASKHFDRTGQRITPEQARKMSEGSG